MFLLFNSCLGVDSLRNVTGVQTGALDPAMDMYWTWNTGYVMAKLEAAAQQALIRRGTSLVIMSAAVIKKASKLQETLNFLSIRLTFGPKNYLYKR